MEFFISYYGPVVDIMQKNEKMTPARHIALLNEGTETYESLSAAIAGLQSMGYDQIEQINDHTLHATTELK